MSKAYIGIGSNIDPERNITSAIQMLRTRVRVTGLSRFYLTEALGRPDSPPFVNGVIEIDTDLGPRELKFDVLRRIEESLGRVRSSDKYAPRTLDLDIIVYGDGVVDEPEIAQRAFVAVPLYELAPDLVLPNSGCALADVVGSLDADSMKDLAEFTRAMREEITNECRESPATD